VDGTVVKFEEAPRDIKEGTVQQDFWCHKMHCTINCQILGNDDGLIHNLNADWQGQTMTFASGPPLLARHQPTAMVSGGWGLSEPISETCITLYHVAEAIADPSKCLYNKRHSGLHTVCRYSVRVLEAQASALQVRVCQADSYRLLCP
jgi:hypothetical protein